ncbi:MAG: hypothetical protein E7666_02580 [Ruminococcaceae bacterium]|nr:hypothetical protein [Oscillospiraceae bacterium]
MQNICEFQTPSKKTTRLGRFWDFFFRMHSLYDKKTDIGQCSVCGRKIQVPQKYHEVPTMYYFLISLVSWYMAALCAYIVPTKKTEIVGIFVWISVCLFAWLFLRAVNAFILSSNAWREVPPDNDESFYENARAIAYKSWKRRFWIILFLILLIF